MPDQPRTAPEPPVGRLRVGGEEIPVFAPADVAQLEVLLRTDAALGLVLNPQTRGHLREALLGNVRAVFVDEHAFIREYADAAAQLTRGESFASAALASELMAHVQQLQRQQRLSTLSDRERDILDAVGRGMRNREVGEAMFISEHTVRNHLASIYRKLGVNTRAAAVARFRREANFDAESGLAPEVTQRSD